MEVFDYNALKDDPLIDPRHHRSEGLAHQHLQELSRRRQGRRHDAGGRRQGDLREAGRASGRQAHHLRKGIKKMAAYNSAEIAAFKGVWVFCEQRQGKLMPTDFELISEGRKLADELGVELCGLLLGDKVDGIAKELGGYGADKVYVCDSPLLKDYTTDGYAKVICDTIESLKPEVLLIGATNIGRDLGPRCAARLHTGLCADCTHLDVDVPKYVDFLRSASTLDVNQA
jgi:hypothetical protein